jgi:hypothetical protein
MIIKDSNKKMIFDEAKLLKGTWDDLICRLRIDVTLELEDENFIKITKKLDKYLYKFYRIFLEKEENEKD